MAQPKTITTIQGDMWDIVSRRAYGSEMHTGALIAANPAHRFVAVFSAGVVLQIPPLTTAAQASENLPPWMRGG